MEYGGYQALDKDENINFGDLTGGLAAAVGGIGLRRKAKRDALDKSADELTKVMDSWETTKTQDLNQFALDGANQGRDIIVKLNKDLKSGAISERQYKEYLNNMNNGWSAFANSAKTYDAQMQEMLKRQQPGPNGEPPAGGAVEAELIELYAEFSDLRNKKFIFGNNGTVGVGSLNGDGTVKEFRDARSINTPGNMIAEPVNLIERADKSTENVKVWIDSQVNKDGTKMTVEDARTNPSYQKYLLEQVNAIAGDWNPNAQASILTDNGGGHFIFSSERKLQERVDSEAELENASRISAGLPAMTDIELDVYRSEVREKGVFMKMDSNGQYVPQLSAKQRESAREIAKEAIEVRLGRKETTVEETTLSKEQAKKAGKYAPRSSSGSGTEEKYDGWAVYATIKAGWEGDTAKLNSNNPDYGFVWDPKTKKMKVYERYDVNGQMIYDPANDAPIASVSEARDLAFYFYKSPNTKGSNSPQDYFDQQKKRYQNERGGSVGGSKPSTGGGLTTVGGGTTR